MGYECTSQYLNLFSKNPPLEVEANRFASELLLPESLFKPLIHQFKPDFEDLADLAAVCNTSLTATTLKYVSLTYERCALIASANNRIRWNKRSSSFNYHIENGTPIAKETLTASYANRNVPQMAASQKTHAALWVEGKGINSYTELFEYCMPMPKYNSVLTLLWFVESYDEGTEETLENRYEESSWKWMDPEE